MKTQRWPALAASLLLASPLAAKVVTGRAAGPVVAAPLIVPSLSAAAAAPSITAPSLSVSPPALIPSAPTVAPLPAASPLLAAAPTSARASILDAVRENDSAAASVGRAFFDGSGELVSQTGAVFVATKFSHPAVHGSVTLVQSRLAPAAAVRPVPGTEGLSGAALLDKIGQIAAKNQKTNEYRAASQYIFRTADHVAVDGVSGVVDAYSGVFVPGTSDDGSDYPETGDRDGDGYPERDGMNIEHTWPQSLFNRGLPMRADIHHLMATFKHPNGVRGALPFGEVNGKPDYQNKAGAKRGGGFFEPPDMTKGRVARNLLYFYARYKNSSFMDGRSARFWNVQIDALMRWNRQFPPDVQEMRRNDLVEQYQGNRNPFVDDPGLADLIGADALRAGRSSMTRTSLAPRSDVPRGGKHRASVKRGRAPRHGRFSRR